MLNGANLAALIRADGNAELIQFQDIALSLGVYTLTTLLRGRRGTEVFKGGHAAGDLFVLVDGEGVTRRPFGLDRLGDTLHYRAVGRGGELRDARTEQLTLAGNDLKPYAPAQLKATGSWGANVTLSWQRRTRVGGELIDGTGEVPLAEDTEQYDLEILFGNAVVRVVHGLTGPSYVYTSADQATDFPGFVAQGLSNPGFETGDLSGWTVESGVPGRSTTPTRASPAGTPAAGSCAAPATACWLRRSMCPTWPTNSIWTWGRPGPGSGSRRPRRTPTRPRAPPVPGRERRGDGHGRSVLHRPRGHDLCPDRSDRLDPGRDQEDQGSAARLIRCPALLRTWLWTM